MEHLNEPPTETDKKMMERVQKAMKLLEQEELIKLIGKMNCGNCIHACSSSKKDTCTEWEE
jgi:heterodisulfide reductase subunit C